MVSAIFKTHFSLPHQAIRTIIIIAGVNVDVDVHAIAHLPFELFLGHTIVSFCIFFSVHMFWQQITLVFFEDLHVNKLLGNHIYLKTAGKWQKCNLVSGMASVASDMGWLWTGWIGPAPVQMSGMLFGRLTVVIVCGLLQGSVVFHWPLVSSWTVTLIILGLGFLRARLLRLWCTATFPHWNMTAFFLQLRKGPLWGCAELLQNKWRLLLLLLVKK